MRLVGWNTIPWGFSASFDVHEAPVWLRLLYDTPFLDRFAYPLLVRRGYGWLQHPAGAVPTARQLAEGWRMRAPDYVAPGSVSELRTE